MHGKHEFVDQPVTLSALDSEVVQCTSVVEAAVRKSETSLWTLDSDRSYLASASTTELTAADLHLAISDMLKVAVDADFYEDGI